MYSFNANHDSDYKSPFIFHFWLSVDIQHLYTNTALMFEYLN